MHTTGNDTVSLQDFVAFSGVLAAAPFVPPARHSPLGPARQPSDPANSAGRLERDAAPFQSLEPERLHSGPSNRGALARSRSAPLHCGNMTASIQRRGEIWAAIVRAACQKKKVSMETM